VIVGGMAYTFQRALGVATGKSLVEEDKIDMAKAAIEKAKAKGVNLLLPVDNILADNSPPTPIPSPGTARSTSRPTGRAGHRSKSIAALKRWSRPPGQSSGTDRPASSSFRASPWAQTPSPGLWRRNKAAISIIGGGRLGFGHQPGRRSRPDYSHLHRAAAQASNSSKARSYPAWRHDRQVVLKAGRAANPRRRASAIHLSLSHV